MKKSKIMALMLSVLMLVALLTPAVYAIDTSELKGIFGILGGGDIDPNGVDGILDSIVGGGSSFNLSDLFGGGTLGKIRDSLGAAAAGASDSDILSGIMSLVGGNSALSQDLLSPDILDSLAALLAGENITTTAPATSETAPILTTSPITEDESTTEEESTTEPVTEEPSVTVPATTEAPATEAPATETPASVYSGADIYTTFPYAEPSTVPTTSAYDFSTYQYVPAVSATVEALVPTSNRIIEDDDYGDEGVSARMIAGIVILAITGVAVAAFAVLYKKNRA